MLESKKPVNFFGTCSKAPFAGAWRSREAHLLVLPKERHEEARSFILPIEIMLVNIGAAFPRIEATR
jgi:hypothetical protein